MYRQIQVFSVNLSLPYVRIEFGAVKHTKVNGLSHDNNSYYILNKISCF